MTCLIGAYVANIIIYNNIFKYLKSHLSILIFKKSRSNKQKNKKYIIFYNNPQFLLLSFVFVKTFLSFQILFPATQQSKTKQINNASTYLHRFHLIQLSFRIQGYVLLRRFHCIPHIFCFPNLSFLHCNLTKKE